MVLGILASICVSDTTSVNTFDVVSDRESVRVIRMLYVPVAVVVPLMVPVEVFKLMPAGSDPAVSDQLYGGVPAAAARVAEYGTAAVASGSDDVVIVSAGTIVNDSVLVAVCGVLVLSLTCTVKIKVPLAVGVPLRTPRNSGASPLATLLSLSTSYMAKHHQLRLRIVSIRRRRFPMAVWTNC